MSRKRTQAHAETCNGCGGCCGWAPSERTERLRAGAAMSRARKHFDAVRDPLRKTMPPTGAYIFALVITRPTQQPGQKECARLVGPMPLPPLAQAPALIVKYPHLAHSIASIYAKPRDTHVIFQYRDGDSGLTGSHSYDR